MEDELNLNEEKENEFHTSFQEIDEEGGEKQEEDEQDGDEVLENYQVEDIDEEQAQENKRVRRCQRRKKIVSLIPQIILPVVNEGQKELNYEEEEEEGENEDGEEEADDRIEEESEADLSFSEYSSVFSALSFEWENKYYEFLDLCDPGTMEDIFDQRKADTFRDEYGRVRYLEFCNVLKIPPIVRFYNSLHSKEVNLMFHGINKKHMQAICAALEFNQIVDTLNFKGNPLSFESCSALSLLLSKTNSLVNLDLCGCRIGPEGAGTLAQGLMGNESLKVLNLDKCYIEDRGMYNLMLPLRENYNIEKLILSNNKLGTGAAESMGILFYTNNSINYLDLDNNYLYDPTGMKKFFKGLSRNSAVTTLYLRWNAISSPEIIDALGQFLKNTVSLQQLDLSDNRLDAVSVRPLRRGISKAESLVVLRLSRNPLEPEDVEYLLGGVKSSPSLRILDLEGIWVRKEFLKLFKKVQQTKDLEVIIGGVHSDYTIYGPDYTALILRRAQFEAKKPKSVKKRRDFGHLMFMLGDEPLTTEQFMELVDKFKANVNKELYPELIKQFTIPRGNLIDVVSMRKKYLSLFPDTQPPETPKPKKGMDEDNDEAQGKTNDMQKDALDKIDATDGETDYDIALTEEIWEDTENAYAVGDSAESSFAGPYGEAEEYSVNLTSE